MASIVARVQKLLALATSPNLHEARNAAYLAAKLIREHNLEIREALVTPRKTPGGVRRTTPSGRKTSSKRTPRVVTAPEPIQSPLGGDCFVCGRRYRAGADILWDDADGGMHAACFDDWLRKRDR